VRRHVRLNFGNNFSLGAATTVALNTVTELSTYEYGIVWKQ
jgi:hypothetical protein